jgi:hypothetical protein
LFDFAQPLTFVRPCHRRPGGIAELTAARGSLGSIARSLSPLILLPESDRLDGELFACSKELSRSHYGTRGVCIGSFHATFLNYVEIEL